MEVAAAAVALSDSDSDSRKHLWNPCEVLEIEPLGYGYTCIGKEVTKGGSECISCLEKKDCDVAKDLLDEIRRTNMADEKPMTLRLRRLARLLLCQDRHRYQAAEKAREWMVKIREHSQGLKESSAELSSSDIQAMNTELGQIKTQLAIIALKYSNLRERHAALLYEGVARRRELSKLKSEHESTVNLLKEENEQREIRLKQKLLEAEELLERAPTNLTGQLHIQKMQRAKKNVSSHEDLNTLRHDISVRERQIASLNPSSVGSEGLNHSLGSQSPLERLSALTDQILSIFSDDHRLQPLFISTLRNGSDSVMRFETHQECDIPVSSFISPFHTLQQELEHQECDVPVSPSTPTSDIPQQKLEYQEYDVPVSPSPPTSDTPQQELEHQECDVPVSSFISPFDTLQQELEPQESSVSVSSFTFTVSYAMDNDRVVRFTPWTMTIRPGYIDRIKRILEKWVRNPVIWWPLQPPKSSCPYGYMRISWACACGTDLSVDMPEKLAREYQQKCSSASNNQPILPLHNNSKIIAAPDGTSTQTQSVSPSSSGLLHRSSQQAALTSDENSAADTKSSLQPDRYVHWCVDANRYETELNHISIPTLDDSDFISKLKHTYWATRGIRQWFSLTDCYGVRFVSFERINRSRDLIACGKEDLPCTKTNKDYIYYYRDPRSQFIKTLQQSLIHCFHNPHSSSCTALNMQDIITRIPKKTNGRLKREYGALGYGMHAVPGWAVWKLMVVLVVSQAGPAVFMIKWLCGHAGDLQNAFSLSMYLIALLNLVVVVPDVWSLQK